MLGQNEEKVSLRPLRPLRKEVSAEASEKGFYRSPPSKGTSERRRLDKEHRNAWVMAGPGRGLESLIATPSKDYHAWLCTKSGVGRASFLVRLCHLLWSGFLKKSLIGFGPGAGLVNYQ